MFRTAPTVQTSTVRPARRVLAAVTACAMALSVITTSVAPARADNNDDLAKALAAIAIIGIIAHQANKDRDHAPAPEPIYHPHPKPPVHHPHPKPPVYHGPRVPAACAIQIEGNRGDRTFFAGRCLRERGFDYRLPGHCAREIRYYGQKDRIYSERCLREAGFQIGRGRDWDRERPQD
ncbi:MAG: hypothetical protein ACRC14_09640 [Paracoccaceae bacterium]